MAEVWVPQRVNVHLASTPDNPNGGVIVLQPGLNEVPPGTETDPFMANLIVTSEDEVALAHQAADAQTAIDEHVATAREAMQTAEKERLDAKTAAGEAWAADNQAAIDMGMAFTDIHPDPVVARSITLTSPPHVYAAVSAPSEPPPEGGVAAASAHRGRVRPEGQGRSRD